MYLGTKNLYNGLSVSCQLTPHLKNELISFKCANIIYHVISIKKDGDRIINLLATQLCSVCITILNEYMASESCVLICIRIIVLMCSVKIDSSESICKLGGFELSLKALEVHLSSVELVENLFSLFITLSACDSIKPSLNNLKSAYTLVFNCIKTHKDKEIVIIQRYELIYKLWTLINAYLVIMH